MTLSVLSIEIDTSLVAKRSGCSYMGLYPQHARVEGPCLVPRQTAGSGGSFFQRVWERYALWKTAASKSELTDGNSFQNAGVVQRHPRIKLLMERVSSKKLSRWLR